nr:AzlD domain-containing protein [Nocardioides flavescens]
MLIAGVALLTAAIKAAGPLVLGARELPARFTRVVGLLAGPLMAALVVTSALADGRHLQVDAATAGVAVAGVLFWRGAPVIVGVLTAVVLTAALRALGAP